MARSMELKRAQTIRHFNASVQKWEECGFDCGPDVVPGLISLAAHFAEHSRVILYSLFNSSFTSKWPLGAPECGSGQVSSRLTGVDPNPLLFVHLATLSI